MKKTELLTYSAANNPIHLVTLGNTQSPKVLLIGGVHGDEPEGAKLAHDFIEKTQGRDFKSCFLVVPEYNPDGLIKNERTNGHGVDLNRNFPSQDWSKEVKAPRYYPGAHPASEPETQALVKLIDQHKPYLIMHIHTYIPQICYTGEKSKKYAQVLAKNFGHPVTEDIGYPTPGSLGQYCLLNLHTPCVCIELPEKVDQHEAWKMTGPGLLEIALHEL